MKMSAQQQLFLYQEQNTKLVKNNHKYIEKTLEAFINDLPIENKSQKFLRLCRKIRTILIVLYDLTRKESKKMLE